MQCFQLSTEHQILPAVLHQAQLKSRSRMCVPNLKQLCLILLRELYTGQGHCVLFAGQIQYYRYLSQRSQILNLKQTCLILPIKSSFIDTIWSGQTFINLPSVVLLSEGEFYRMLAEMLGWVQGAVFVSFMPDYGEKVTEMTKGPMQPFRISKSVAWN